MDETTIALERELEESMKTEGRDDFRRTLNKAREKHRESSTKTGIALLRQVLSPRFRDENGQWADITDEDKNFVKAVQTFIEESKVAKAGKKLVSGQLILKLNETDPKDAAVIAAYLTAKVILDGISARPTITKVASDIGKYIEDEVRFGVFEDKNPKRFRWAVKNAKGKSPEYARKGAGSAMKRSGLNWEHWTPQEHVHLGIKLISLFIETTGLVEAHAVRPGTKRERKQLIATPATAAWINSRNASAELLSPLFQPMIVQPKPWTTPFDGGYYDMNDARRLTMVKSRNRDYLEEIAAADMPEVYEALNAMQDTAWQVNTRVFETMTHVWHNTSDPVCMPPKEPLPIPVKPADISTNEEARKLWRRSAAAVYEKNLARFSKTSQVSRVLKIAEKFKDQDAIYFPYVLDFRGRAYAVPLFLHPQGPDYAKGLLRFSEGIALGEQGACFLAIHGANCWGQGVEKLPLQGRIDWAQNNGQMIKAIAADPLSNRQWQKTDEPFQFLAFCFEWAEYLVEGVGYKSHLAVALDGSCNGLQHYSAAMRDEIGGAAVNLIPHDVPADIYQRVADEVRPIVEKDAKAFSMSDHRIGMEIEKLRAKKAPAADVLPYSNCLVARQWVASKKINRSATKKTTMTMVYGSTKFGARLQVHDTIADWIEDGDRLPFSGDGFEAAAYLGNLIYDSLGKVVVKAREAMDMLQVAAEVSAKEGLPLSWITPTGMPILQAYKKSAKQVINTKIGGKRLQLTVANDTNTTDRAKQRQGIAPNFVHSLDAAHLQRTVAAAKQHGISAFALVHDSFGTHAAHTELFAAVLREAFISIHQDDVLATFRQRLRDQLSDDLAEELDGKAPLPSKGTLDIEQVRESAFFFN